MRLIITYDPNNDTVAIGDGTVERHYQAMLNGLRVMRGEHPLETTTSNFLLINRVRLGIVRKELDWQDVTVNFGQTIITFNEHSHPNQWPSGFGDHTETMLGEILHASSAIYRASKQNA
jgi:hypothetical protein